MLAVDEVLGSHACGIVLLAQDVGVLIFAHAADVDGRFGREDVLGAPCGILGGAAGEEDGGAVVEEVFVDAEMFFFGEDGVVGLEAVFF